MKRPRLRLTVVLRNSAAALIPLGFVPAADAQQDGFLLPWKTVEIASDETGILQEVLVVEGERVKAGQVLARLRSDVEQVQYELATHLAQSRGNYVAAGKNWEKRKSVYDQVRQMLDANSANETELMRAELELELAAARLASARDELIAREIELRRAKIQLERRNITAPTDGFVAALHVAAGEHVSPLHSEIARLVNTDRLYAVFNIPSSQVDQFVAGKTFHIQVSGGTIVEGKVEMVGVAIDAESGTVQVKLLVENGNQQLRAGDSCTLLGG